MATSKLYRLSDFSLTEDTITALDGERDEVLEIRKQSAADTRRVRTWRIMVMVALLVTAVTVTVTTYKLLVDREDENFRSVVSSRGVLAP